MNILIVAFAQNFRADSKNIEIENKVMDFIKKKIGDSYCAFLSETRYIDEPLEGSYAWQPWNQFASIIQNFKIWRTTGIEWDVLYYLIDDCLAAHDKIEEIEEIVITGHLTPIEYIRLGVLLQSFLPAVRIKFTNFYGVAPTEILKQMNIEIEK